MMLLKLLFVFSQCLFIPVSNNQELVEELRKSGCSCPEWHHHELRDTWKNAREI